MMYLLVMMMSLKVEMSLKFGLSLSLMLFTNLRVYKILCSLTLFSLITVLVSSMKVKLSLFLPILNPKQVFDFNE